ncbi:protein MANNAN SYNTHESIS-RELATED 2-like [Punica granatum]|uniref:O-fucosyltransferase family protein n=2 Tax=Punica granatum TaxID=22663 RepID=A0A218XWS5_PUNGR|nr:protein MANNAN SYNTHESIS-RELATED 2-like [Punica granatum]OWM89059.1 hypothetical protein CDL15_Pgr023905 [Punica granatum]PKI52639.1 hypothetical protein CRG98_026979 [Punica granatum]
MRVRMVDLRQVLGAILTLSMFAMLANMIKQDHFNYFEVKYPPVIATMESNTLRITEQIRPVINFPRANNNGILVDNRKVLKSCWKFSSSEKRHQPKGYIMFSLTNGPTYHMAQVANAVVVAKYLGATLVLPDFRGKKLEERRNFTEIYDDQRFADSLKGIVEVSRNWPSQAYVGKAPVVRVPSMVSEDYIEAHVKPLFHEKGILRVSTYFPLISTRKNDATKVWGPVLCLARFKTLQLQPHIRGIVDGMIWRMRKSGEGPNGNIISIDLRDDVFQSKSCRQLGGGRINICDVKKVGKFLRENGFGPESAIYLTHSRWHHNLDPLRELFPKTYTKELLIHPDQRQKLLGRRDSELRKVIDFVMCTDSDVFVPIIKDQFSTSVVGCRIASRRMQILAPAKILGFSASASDSISPNVPQMTHLAHSCLC